MNEAIRHGKTAKSRAFGPTVRTAGSPPGTSLYFLIPSAKNVMTLAHAGIACSYDHEF